MQINNAAGIYAAQLNQYQSNTTTSVKSETSPNTLQSDKVTLSAAATAESPSLNRGGGVIITNYADSPSLNRGGGVIITNNAESPSLNRGGGVIITNDASTPELNRGGGVIITG